MTATFIFKNLKLDVFSNNLETINMLKSLIWRVSYSKRVRIFEEFNL